MSIKEVEVLYVLPEPTHETQGAAYTKEQSSPSVKPPAKLAGAPLGGLRDQLCEMYWYFPRLVQIVLATLRHLRHIGILRVGRRR